MQDAKPELHTPQIDRQFRSDRVDNPEQYATWRDYAFSEEPESERTPPR
jgi:hypothetical protein